ncbi:MAG TPA: c-type cytochrome [Afifellaceae bacterium]|nr:c-type cytochrome [Afifellaceae bacterium]
MSRLTTLLTSAIVAFALAGVALAQPQDAPEQTEQPGAATGAEQGDQPAIETEDGRVVFRDPLTNEVLDVPQEDVTPAVEEFHQTGENPYSGDEEAAADGRTLYGRLCAACHLPAGTGRIGPSLVDDNWRYPRADTDVGVFEVICAGGAGAMMAFCPRISQDEILRIMAHIDQLRADAQ